MNRQGDWDMWNQRLGVIWADSVQGSQIIGEDGQPPSLKINGVSLPLGPSNWGLGDAKEDVARVEEALEVLVQGRAPDYWRNAQDPLIQALGWLDRRIGKRSWRLHDEMHGPAGRTPLERQIRALRDHADSKLTAPAPSTLRSSAKRSP